MLNLLLYSSSVDTDDEDRYHEPIDERPIALAYEVELCQNDEAPELYLTDEEVGACYPVSLVFTWTHIVAP